MLLLLPVETGSLLNVSLILRHKRRPAVALIDPELIALALAYHSCAIIHPRVPSVRVEGEWATTLASDYSIRHKGGAEVIAAASELHLVR